MDGQALANVTVDITWTNYVVFLKKTITVSSDIIDFNKSNDTPKFKNEGLIGRKIEHTNGVKIGDTVLINKKKSSLGTIVHLTDDKIYIKKIDVVDKTMLYTSTKYNKIQKRNFGSAVNDNTFHVGDSILFKRKSKIQAGIINSVGYEKLYVLFDNRIKPIAKNKCMALE